MMVLVVFGTSASLARAKKLEGLETLTVVNSATMCQSLDEYMFLYHTQLSGQLLRNDYLVSCQE